MVIASCGHTLADKEGLGIGIQIKEWAKDGSPAVVYMNVCKKCFKVYEKKELLLKTKKAEEKWLGRKNE